MQCLESRSPRRFPSPLPFSAVVLAGALLAVLAPGGLSPARAADSAAQTTPATQESIVAAIPRFWPPYYVVEPDESAQPAGFAIDVLEAVTRQAGYRVQYQVWPTMPEAYDATLTGKANVVPSVGVIAARQGDFLFTGPVETFVVSLFVRRDSQDIDKVEDLDGRKVAVIAANVGVNLMKKHPLVDSIVYEDTRTALFDLLAGQVDALIYPQPVIEKMAVEIGVEGQIKTAGAPLLEVKRAIGVHPSRPDIHRRLAAAVEQFVHTPAYQKIYVKWFGRPETYWSAQRVASVMGLLLIVVIAVLAVWHYVTVMRLNRTLEVRVRQRTAELQRAQDEIVRNERLATLGQLTGTVAHELRNPLGAILTSFEIMQIKARAANLDFGKPLERARRNIDRCNGIITDLLDFARAKGVQPESVDLDGYLGDILDEYETPASVMLVRQFGLAGAAASIDREQIRRLVVNLLDNACEAMETEPSAAEPAARRAAGTLTVTTRMVAGAVEIIVSDSGRGMSTETMSHIFEPLFSTRAFGVGLGLPHAKRIAEQHGGSLTVASRPGSGTDMTIFLPVAAAKNAAAMS